MRRRAVAAGAVLLALLLSGCSGEAPVRPAPRPSSASPAPLAPELPDALGPLGRAGCAPPSPLRAVGLPEVQATPDGATSAFGLIFGRAVPLVASRRTVKLVWRVTGSGLLELSVRKPSGQAAGLAWGPTYHSESTYRRPGEEWGMGLVLDAPGCWEVRLHRSTGTARAWLRVAPAAG